MSIQKICLILSVLWVQLTGARVHYAAGACSPPIDRAATGEASQALLEKEFSPRLQAIKKKMAELHSLALKLRDMGPGTNSFKRAAALENYHETQKALQQQERSYETALQLRRSQLRDNFTQLVSNDIKAYAQAHGIDVVVKSGGIYEAPGVDLTSRILKRLEQDYRQAKAQAITSKKQ